MRRLTVTSILLFCVLGQSVSAQGTASGGSTEVTNDTRMSELVDVGGHRLYLECRGEGSPTVVLEAGYRSSADVWSDDLIQPDAPRQMVFEGVSTFTRVCLYERPGVAAVLDDGLHPSRSDPVPMPRTARSVVRDLHTLLNEAGVSGPYVLVGHSLGGLFARLYASTYPDEVVGLVLVDAWYEELEHLLTMAQWDAYVRLNSARPAALEEYSALETIDFADASVTMRRKARSLNEIPLAVLAHGQPFGITEEELGFSPDALEKAWRKAQEELASLKPDAYYVVAATSSHYVQLQQPELVIDAVEEIVDEVRRSGRQQ